MDVQLLYFDGCPHWAFAEERLRSALASIGRDDETIQRVLVEAPEDSERLGFIGSPTILRDGRDPFATGNEQPALACRVFTTPDGRTGSPTVPQLAEALHETRRGIRHRPLPRGRGCRAGAGVAGARLVWMRGQLLV